MSGWIKLHRSLTQHWLWEAEPFSKSQAWIDLLLRASHTGSKVYIKGQLVELERGQQARSEVTLAASWKWSRDKVRRFLSRLENEGMIRQQKSKLTSVITICNYSDFQGANTADDTTDNTTDNTTKKQPTRQRKNNPQDNRQDTDKNEKKGKNENKKPSAAALDFSSWPEMPSDQVLADYKKNRNAHKATFSQTVVNTMGKELHALAKHGVSVDQALGVCCNRGWRGLKSEWVLNDLSKQGSVFPAEPGNPGNDARAKKQQLRTKLRDIGDLDW